MENSNERNVRTEGTPESVVPKVPRIRLEIPEVSFQVTEAINTLRGNIQFSGYDIKVICVTSSIKHEGKSSLSFRLARSFAALGKRVLYLDCDIRNSQTVVRYGIRNYNYGLTEYLCGKVSMNSIVIKTTEPGLDLILTGPAAPNPSELFSGELFHKLILAVRKHYDYVIVDTAPVNAVIDGVLIAKQCDGTVLVVESGVSEIKETQRAKQQLDYAGVKILGVALNKLGHGKGGYGYGYGYGYVYGYGEEKKSKRKKRK